MSALVGSGAAHGAQAPAHAVVFVRHGRTAYNAEHRLQGQVDIPLDAVGLWQAARSGEALRERYGKPQPLVQGPLPPPGVSMDAAPRRFGQVVISSDLGRSMQTAHAFADPLGLPVHAEPGVRERSFGDWDGELVEELNRRDPVGFAECIFAAGGLPDVHDESKAEVGDRGAAAVERWTRTVGPDNDLFVFSHGACIVQTVLTLMGLGGAGRAFEELVSLRNAHWCRMVPTLHADGSLVWRLAEYNVGPAVAERVDWNNPPLD